MAKSPATITTQRTDAAGRVLALGLGLVVAVAVAMALAVTPSKAEAQAATLADLLIAASGDSRALTAITGACDLTTIRDVVKYHVVATPLTLIQVLRTKQFDTVLPGASFTRGFLSPRDNDPDLLNPGLALPLELERGQSIAHTINRVLIPVDI